MKHEGSDAELLAGDGVIAARTLPNRIRGTRRTAGRSRPGPERSEHACVANPLFRL
jgi:hypothetical protein